MTRSVTMGLVAAMTLALTACSEGNTSGGADAETSAALKVCEEVFGADGVSAARAVLGDSDFRAESQPLDRIRESMLKEVRAYTPGSEDYSRNNHEPCNMSTSDGGTVKRVYAHIAWSHISMDHVSVDDTKREWTKAADDVYVQRVGQLGALAAVLPCRVPGAKKGQERDLPLEISVRSHALGPDRDTLAGRLLASLVRDTRKRLGCENPVAVPTSLLPK
ncbi:hypothetical protein ACIGW4_29780 [Streptomyces sp. NPDC053513]|uniref:Lipoprotein n=1 Tax=Streptomyces litmocidini TaxID=67318 RepID=A0ABW7UFI1_9ACTN